MSSGNGKIVNQAELAEIFGVTAKSIQNWVAKGCPVLEQGKRGAANRYNTADVAAWRLEQLRQAENKPVDLEKAKARKEAALAEMAELDLDMKRGAVVPIELVKKAVAKEYAEIRANFLAMPGEIASDLENLDSASIEEVMASKVSEILEALASDGSNQFGE